MLIDVISCYGRLYHNEIQSNVICHVLITNLTQCKLIDPWEIWKEFKSVISEHLLQIKLMNNANIIALRWIPQNTFDGKSTLVQVMAWCHQATSQYLNHFFTTRQQAITWANVDPDLCPHQATISELFQVSYMIQPSKSSLQCTPRIMVMFCAFLCFVWAQDCLILPISFRVMAMIIQCQWSNPEEYG